MLSWMAIDRPHLRHSTPILSSLRTQRLCVGFSGSFSPSFHFVSHLPYLLPSSVSRKSCICHSRENTGDVGVFFLLWNDSGRPAGLPRPSAGHRSPNPFLTSLPSYLLLSLL